MSGSDRLAERRILKALAEGKLSDLAGAGRPLPDHPEAAFVDAGMGVGFRMMAEAGALPPEIALKKAEAAMQAQLSKTTDPDTRRALIAELAEISMRRAMAEETRRRFFR